MNERAPGRTQKNIADAVCTMEPWTAATPGHPGARTVSLNLDERERVPHGSVEW